MKRYNILILLLLLNIAAFAAITPKYDFKKSKEISKTWSTNATPNLSLENKYGNINVTTWDKHSINIEISIEVSSNNEQNTQEMLDLITINFNSSTNSFSANTKIGERKKSWWSNNKTGSNMEYKINYTVKIPIGTDLTIINKYGDIYINKLAGKLNLTAKYGYCSIGELLNENNTIAVKYFELSDINYIKGGNFVSKYSKFAIDTAEALNLTSDYCEFNIDTVSKLNFNNKYGNIIINKVSDVLGTGKYIKLIFRDIKNKLTLNTKYGSLKIKEQQSAFKSFNINSNYTSTTLQIDNKLSYSFNISGGYGSFKAAPKTQFSSKTETYNSKQYKGYYGDNNTKNNITATFGYGNFEITTHK